MYRTVITVTLTKNIGGEKMHIRSPTIDDDKNNAANGNCTHWI